MKSSITQTKKNSVEILSHRMEQDEDWISKFGDTNIIITTFR
jgi:hypothetical protein